MPSKALDEQGSDRVQIMQHPPGLPGKCAICGYPGSDPDRYFIIFGLEIDWYGQVIFCNGCLVTIGDVMGFVTPEKYDEAIARLQEATTTNAQLGSENEQLRSVIHTITGSVANLPVGPTLPESDVESEPELPDNESEPADSLPAKPASKQRSNDVPSVTSDDLSSSLAI